jgi:hypothetical protein
MIARGDIQKADLQERMAQKRREEKMVKSFQSASIQPAPEERMKYLAAAAQAMGGSEPLTAAPAGSPVEVTAMDHVLAEEKRIQALGTADLSRARPAPPPPKKKLFTFAFQKQEAEEEEQRKVAGT